MRALLDTNVLLDLFLERQPFVEQAEQIWDAAQQKRFDGFISALTPVNVFYNARKIKGAEISRYILASLFVTFSISPLTQEILETALSLPQKDYEDAVQVASAVAGGIDAIVTRDPRDYSDAAMKIYSPAEFLKSLEPAK